jgi:hypothetical protein
VKQKTNIDGQKSLTKYPEKDTKQYFRDVQNHGKDRDEWHRSPEIYNWTEVDTPEGEN